MPVLLNHSFLVGIAHRASSPADIRALKLLQHVRQRLGANVLVHPDIRDASTGGGPFIAWANQNRRDVIQGPMIELLLRTTSGPYVTDLLAPDVETVTPSIEALADWLQQGIRILLGHGGEQLSALVSPAPTGGADEAEYSAGTFRIENWFAEAAVDQALVSAAPDRSTADVLTEARAQVAGMVVLDSALRSARAWQRDCSAEDLHRALLALPVYARELARRLHDGQRPSREQAAKLYHHQTGIPMSRETSAVSRQPNRRRERTFNAGPSGNQFFDMHAKPGNLTRIHVWVYVDDADEHAQPIIYVGHCGKHLS